MGRGFGAADSVFRTGCDPARATLHGASPLRRSFGPLKSVDTVLSSSGGIVAPSLAVGAGQAENLRGPLPMAPIGCRRCSAW